MARDETYNRQIDRDDGWIDMMDGWMDGWTDG